MGATTAVALGGMAMSGYQLYQGAQDKKRAERAFNNYNRQDLVNPYENMPVSTFGTDYMREETSRNVASMVDASRNAGARGIYSNIPKLVAYNNDANRETQIMLDDQVQKRNYAIAGDEVAIRGINESRDEANLAGIGNLMEVGRQDMWSGLRGMGASAMYGINNGAFSTEEGDARREAWREFKRKNPDANRSDFMAANPKSNYIKKGF